MLLSRNTICLVVILFLLSRDVIFPYGDIIWVAMHWVVLL